MEENTKEQRGVVFNEDGTIDPAQLAGMPQEFIDRVQSPEFIANAKRQIQERRVADYSLGLYRKKVAKIEAAARVEHAQRRPNGVSGRQRKRLRRLARKLAAIGSSSENDSEARAASPEGQRQT
jgi:hypothetical protein